MKKLIALMMALVLALSLTACFGTNTDNSTADEANAAPVDTYEKDFTGLLKYINDRNGSATKSELYYDILGAKGGERLVLNNNAYVEVYDFSNIAEDGASADSADPEKAQSVLAAVKENGKFTPLEDGTEMTAAITSSGKYLLAWDATRSYDYEGKVATDELIENW